MAPDLHVVCLDAPAPPTYGGAIEMYYKIEALAAAGLRLHLHYFTYKAGRDAAPLLPLCEAAFAYKRITLFTKHTFSKPHTVASRINQTLIDRLNRDAAPVLLEGIHTTGIIPFLKDKNRVLLVRMHNDEAAYYNRLARYERNRVKRFYFNVESMRLHQYQQKVAPLATYLALTDADARVLKTTYGKKSSFVIPAFLPWQKVQSLRGKGTYCLYHGNLAVAENEAAALWLIRFVFATCAMPFIVAGSGASAHLKKAMRPYQHMHLVPDPSGAELEKLIADAHIHVLPDFNTTGVKLKVLHALFCGRFCITSTPIVTSDTVAVAHTAAAYMGFLKSFMDRPFTEQDKAARSAALAQYNNQKNAAHISAFLSTHYQ